jgi:hypothetical protein
MITSPRPRFGAGSNRVRTADARQISHSKCRSLLALDGERLSPDQLKEAQAKCLQVADRVDILLVNPTRPPTSMLCDLLIKLEESGIDYRLTAVSGKLSDHVSQYIRRFMGITLIMVATLPTLGDSWRIKVADLRHQGYRLISLCNSPAC